MDKDKFIKIINHIKKRDKIVREWRNVGIDIIESEMMDSNYAIERIFFVCFYGKQGYNLIQWWLYEKPEGEVGAWDENKNPICTTIEDLWEYLEKEYAKKV